MLAFRVLALAAVAVLAISVVLYLLTRERRYLRFAWNVLRLFVVFVLAFGALAVLERVILV